MYKNPIDFTHKSVYAEMDRQIEQDRYNRYYMLISFVVGFFIAMALAIYLLKNI